MLCYFCSTPSEPVVTETSPGKERRHTLPFGGECHNSTRLWEYHEHFEEYLLHPWSGTCSELLVISMLDEHTHQETPANLGQIDSPEASEGHLESLRDA